MQHFTTNHVCKYEGGALDGVQRAQESLKNRDYKSLVVAANEISVSPNRCVLGDLPSNPPYPDHSNLPQNAYVVEMAQADFINGGA
ncbi:hypothetical protein Fmac_006981 [Flemingia macrophylla]|uniref:Uncharacterized protein n=1 Tax=Flemingia macrophylla TaxID=520843 RepID=A0ABD1NC64_9FABA